MIQPSGRWCIMGGIKIPLGYRDQGSVLHYVLGYVAPPSFKPARCGATPGKRSMGWMKPQYRPIHCARCLQRLGLRFPPAEL